MKRTPPLIALLTFATAQAAPAPAPSTYGALGGQYWLWTMMAPMRQNPIEDRTGRNCGVAQTRPVFFLAAAYVNGDKVSRTCTVPAGKPLFFPLVTARAFEPTKEACESVMSSIKPDMDVARKLSVSVDGKTTFAGKALNSTRGTMRCTYLKDFEMWLGSDGYWASVTFDKPGRHTVAWTGAIGSFRLNVSYALTVR